MWLNQSLALHEFYNIFKEIHTINVDFEILEKIDSLVEYWQRIGIIYGVQTASPCIIFFTLIDRYRNRSKTILCFRTGFMYPA